MMNYIKTTLLVATTIFTSSCGNYDKLLKSRDYLAMYDAALEYYEEGKNNRVITLLTGVESILDGTSKADTIKFYLAKTYYLESDYATSTVLLDDFRKQYTRSPFAEEAEYLYAMSHYSVSPNYELDQGPARQAQSAFYEYKSRYPTSERVTEVSERIDELQKRFYDKSFNEAFTYYKIGAYNSAVMALNNAIKLNPNSPHKEEMMFLVVKSNFLFARNSVESRKRERYYNTIDAAYNFTSSYTESKYLDEVNSILTNAKRLSKSDALTEGDIDIELSDEQIIKHNKLIEKLQKRVEDGKMTKEEADNKEKSVLKKTKAKAKKRLEREAAAEQSEVLPKNTESQTEK